MPPTGRWCQSHSLFTTFPGRFFCHIRIKTYMGFFFVQQLDFRKRIFGLLDQQKHPLKSGKTPQWIDCASVVQSGPLPEWHPHSLSYRRKFRDEFGPTREPFLNAGGMSGEQKEKKPKIPDVALFFGATIFTCFFPSCSMNCF